MKILVIDGQGGKMGRALVEGLLARMAGSPPCLPECVLVAVGTNSEATAAMRNANANNANANVGVHTNVGVPRVHCATGENPVLVNAADADIILGPMGLIAANSLLGEITPAMALAISASKAKKILVPVSRCGVAVAGVNEELSMGELIKKAVDMAAALAGLGTPAS